MMDRPEQFRFDLGYAVVKLVYPESWEVDLQPEDGGAIFRALVIGPHLPEAVLKADPDADPPVNPEERPQWVVFAFAGQRQGLPICWPIQSRLPGTRSKRKGWVYYDELLNWRITINRENEVEILHAKGKYHILLQEKDGVIRIEVPEARVVLTNEDKTILIECTEKLTVHCKDADVHVEHDATVKIDNDATVDIGNDATVKIDGNLSAEVGGDADAIVTGDLSVTAANAIIEAAEIDLNGLVVVT